MSLAPSQFLPNLKAMTENAEGVAASPIKILSSRFDTGQISAQIGRVEQAFKLGMT